MMALVVAAGTACQAPLQPEPEPRDAKDLRQTGQPNVDREALDEANKRLQAYADESKPVMENVQEAGTGTVGGVSFGEGDGQTADSKETENGPETKQKKEAREAVELEFVNTSLRSIIDLMFKRYIEGSYTVLPDYQDKDVNWLVSGKYTQKELLKMFEAFLEVHGVYVDKKGGVYTVGSSPQTATLDSDALGQKTAIFRLDHLKAQAAVQVLRRFVRRSENVQVLVDINAVIATGSSAEISQMDLFLERVDRPVFDDKTVILYKPAHVSPQALTALVQQLPKKMAGSGRDVQTVIEAQPVQNHDMVVIVVDQGVREKMMELVRKVDSPSGEQRQLFYYTLETQEASQVRSTLTNVFPDMIGGDGSVTLAAHEPKNALLVRATPSRYYQIKKVIDRMDFTVPSVMIDAAIVEVQLNDNMQFGVEWFLDQEFGDEVVSDVGVDLAQDVTGGLTAGAVSLTDNTFATLSLLQSKTSLSVLSRPRVIVKNNETAKIETVNEVKTVGSVETSDIEQDGATGFTRNFETREPGVVLEVTPKVQDNGQVSMEVTIEDSRQGADQTIGGLSLPTFNRRELNTQLVAKNGESIFIGGLIQQLEDRSQRRIPFFADIPYVGNAFKNTDTERNRTELLIFLTPYLMLDEQAARLISEAIVDTVDEGRLGDAPAGGA